MHLRTDEDVKWGAFDAFNMLGWVAGYAVGALFLEFLRESL
jgi:hypothetical protein